MAVAVGGACGAGARWAVIAHWPNRGGFPWAVLLINCAGSLLIGALLAEEWTILGRGCSRTTLAASGSAAV